MRRKHASLRRARRTAVNPLRDEFLSEEDLDLKTLSDEELDVVWTRWLQQAQITNDADALEYSHGVFTREPSRT